MYNDMYTVFAGGDDLFLIGPWNRIMNLVRDLRRDFARYVCHNTHVHFSAGIALSKAHTPLEQMAIEAEAALEASKSERNRLTIFGETMTYDDYDELISIRDVMMGWLEDEWINNAMLYRLNTLIDMAALERKLIGSVKPFALKELECTKWRSYLAYSADRNLAKGLTGDDRGRTSRSMAESIASWLERFGGKMNVPLWEILYNRR
jgi:CRISPR-associated protein Csm1